MSETNTPDTFKHLPVSIRFVSLKDIAEPVVLKGTPLPVTREIDVATSEDSQTGMTLVFQAGDSEASLFNDNIGSLHVRDLPGGRAGNNKVTVRAQVDRRGTAHIECIEQGRGVIAEREIDVRPVFMPEHVAALRDRAASNSVRAKEIVANSRLRQEASFLVRDAERQVQDLMAKKSSADYRKTLEQAVAEVGAALVDADLAETKRATDRLRNALSSQHRELAAMFDAMLQPRGTVGTKKQGPTKQVPAARPAGVARSQLSDVKPTAMESRKRRVFIGHGRSPVWKDVKSLLVERLSLSWLEFNRESAAGVANAERLQELLRDADFAFVVLTAEDSHADGELHARENVIHEVGLFQGRLGFRKAIILLEDGCKEFTNIQGLGQIRFPRGNVAASSEQIRQVLEREGLIPRPQAVSS